MSRRYGTFDESIESERRELTAMEGMYASGEESEVRTDVLWHRTVALTLVWKSYLTDFGNYYRVLTFRAPRAIDETEFCDFSLISID